MHRSKLPLTTWFWAAHLMATHSNGMSARQLADQLGVTYKTAWLLTQKLRRSMVDPNRAVSFETMLGFVARHQPASYWDIIERDNPRKGHRR